MFAALDTNHFREVAQGADHAAAIERRATEARLELFTTIITVQEATAGWLALINRLTAGREQIRAYERFQATITAFSKFDILPFDEEAANHFHKLQSARVRIGTMDLKIAPSAWRMTPRCSPATSWISRRCPACAWRIGWTEQSRSLLDAPLDQT